MLADFLFIRDDDQNARRAASRRPFALSPGRAEAFPAQGNALSRRFRAVRRCFAANRLNLFHFAAYLRNFAFSFSIKEPFLGKCYENLFLWKNFAYYLLIKKRI
jgi:hypothetical protein